MTSKLIRVRDQIQVWSASIDSEPGSMLEFQQQLSTAIAEQIRLRLSPERLSASRRGSKHRRRSASRRVREHRTVGASRADG